MQDGDGSPGGSVDVPTTDGGKVRLTIPEGTQSGHNFRLKASSTRPAICSALMRKRDRARLYSFFPLKRSVRASFIGQFGWGMNLI